MPSELKTMMVKEIDRRIGSSKAVVLVGLNSLNGAESIAVRRVVSDAGASLFLLKNTLAALVFKQRGWKGLDSSLIGQTAVLCGDDPVALAQLSRKITKDYAGKVEARGGWLAGKVCSAREVVIYADLPPYEVLVATFLATVSSPVTNLLSTVSSPISNLLNVLEQVRDSAEGSKAS